jgi:hypothetical protein
MKSNYDLVTLSLLLNIVPFYLFYYNGDIIQSTLIILSSNSSYLYHITYESSQVFLYLDMFFATLCGINFVVRIYYSNYQLLYTYMLLQSLYFYYLGTGRNKEIERTYEYKLYHTLWHISGCLTATIYAILENSPIHILK